MEDDTYTLDHIPEQYRPKACKQLLEKYKRTIESKHWKKLLELKENNFVTQTQSYYVTKTEYDKQLKHLNQMRSVIDAYLKEHPEFMI